MSYSSPIPFQQGVIVVSGATRSGKTHFVYKLLSNIDKTFSSPHPQAVIFCYAVYQSLYDKICENIPNCTMHRGLPNEEEIEIRYYSIIYDLIDDVKAAMSGMLAPELREQIIGVAEVKDVFRSPKFGDIAGCIVSTGTIKKSNPIRVLRDNVVIYEGELESLRRFKDDVNEVKSGTECGIGVKNYDNVQPGDQIEVFERIEVARTI